MSSTPLVSVVIANWNGKNLLTECLEALDQQTFRDKEVIIVDNGSTDGSVALLREMHRDSVRLLENDRNEGFASANNLAIRHARGRFIVTLNNDTRVDPDWLKELVAAAESHPDGGMFASKILLCGNPGVIDSAGVNIYPDGMSRQRGRLQADGGQFSMGEQVLMPSACAALYRKRMLDETGLFDSDFFAYCEDTDLGLRGRLAGWESWFVPTAVVHHRLSATTGRYSPLKAFLVERNHYWVAAKNFPLERLLYVPFFSLYRLWVQARSAAVHSRRDSTFRTSEVTGAVLKGQIAAIRGLSACFRKRKVIWRNKRAPTAEVNSWFNRYRLRVSELRLADA